MDYQEINQYIKSHGVALPNGQVFLKKPIFGFKKIRTFTVEPIEKIDRYSEHYLFRGIAQKMGYPNHITGAIANIGIPAGALVNLCDTEKKLRADTAFCWNIIRIKDEKEVSFGWSKYDLNFIYRSTKFLYRPNKGLLRGISIQDFKSYLKEYSILGTLCPEELVMTPSRPFNKSDEICESGIHFFLEPSSAVYY